MLEKTKQEQVNFGRLAIFFDITKIKKYFRARVFQFAVHVFLIIFIIIILNLVFPNLFLEEGVFIKYIKTLVGWDVIKNQIEWHNQFFTADSFERYYRMKVFYFIGEYLVLVSLIYLPVGIFLDKKIEKILINRAKEYDTKVLSGTVILENDKFIDKYNQLCMNHRDGIFISDVYKLEEITEDTKDRE